MEIQMRLSNSALILVGALGATANLATEAAAQSVASDLALIIDIPAVIHACYAPNTGTIYRIKESDLKQNCTSNSHVEFTWNQQGPKGDPGIAIPFDGSTTIPGNAFRLVQDGTGSGAAAVFRKTGGTGAAVIGEGTGTRVGVRGSTSTGVGVQGLGGLGGVGVEGHTGLMSGAGVRASGPAGGTALEILNGGIKVTGAGIGTSTPVFIHRESDGAAGSSSTTTVIDHPLTNNDPNAILLVTRRTSEQWEVPINVFYNLITKKWAIRFRSNPGGAFTAVQSFNVMVIKP
jgi:hypothetical protein